MDDGLQEYLADIEKYAPLSPAEERGLLPRVRAGDPAAMELLVTSNLRLVVAVADEYVGRGVSRYDLINEGNLGLIRAAHRCDQRADDGFAACADRWIRDAIGQAVAERTGARTGAPLRSTGDARPAT